MVVATYIILFVITLYSILIVRKLYKKSGSLVPVIPVVVMYFWSIYGAWSWIPLKMAGKTGPYEEILFTVNVDDNYFMMILLYSVFIIIFSQYILANIRRGQFDSIKSSYYFKKIEALGNSKTYKFFILALWLGYVLFTMRDISSAMSGDVSAYQLSRFDSTAGIYRTLVQFMGDTFTYLSIPLLFLKNNKKCKIRTLLLFTSFFGINFVLGNRNVLICGLIIGVILYSELYGCRKLLKIKTIVIGACLLTAIQFISFVRGLSVNALLQGGYQYGFFEVLTSTTHSSEQYAAQISMYGVLKYDVPITFGRGVLYFFSTFIPSIVGLERPERLYQYYLQQTVHQKLDIGVTIHHATGWYLDFGVVGIVIGGLLWGYVLLSLYNRKRSFVFLYGAIVFSVISIQMIRDAGIESYKGGFLLATVIPMLIIYFCTKKRRKLTRDKEPVYTI